MTADITSTTTLDNIQREQEQRLREELITPSRSMDELVKEAQRSAQMQSTKENNNV